MRVKERLKEGELVIYKPYYNYLPRKKEYLIDYVSYVLILSDCIYEYKNNINLFYYYCLKDTGKIEKIFEIDLRKI